jgi:hypothetical protein
VRFHKYYWCPVCQDERVCACEAEVSDSQPYAVGSNPDPDVVRATAAWCEEGHELSLGAAQEIAESVVLRHEVV